METGLPSPWRPHYEHDELALGVALAVALHVLPLALILFKAAHPGLPDSDQPTVARPVVAASLMKLGKPIDPSKLPDRLKPRARTAPKHEVTASREDPSKKDPDAGAPPPPDTKDSDLSNLIAKSDPFAEDAGKARPEEGAANGVKEGLETDPSKVRAGDMFAAQMNSYFHERWQYPTVISQGEANKLCVAFRLSINTKMVIWHVQQEPVRKSGNDLFDDSARSMLQKLLDDRTPLPQPPDEVAELYRGRTLELVLQGNPNGDGSRCK
jgi:hypothetical protein